MKTVIRSLLMTVGAAGLAAGATALPTAMAVAGPAPEAFEPGFYRITPVDPDSRATEKARSLCVADSHVLLRFKHHNATSCRDQFVQPGRDRTTVTYSCDAEGWGRTELRRETPGLYQLDTQGIAGKRPFALRAEARRIGGCPGHAGTIRPR